MPDIIHVNHIYLKMNFPCGDLIKLKKIVDFPLFHLNFIANNKNIINRFLY